VLISKTILVVKRSFNHPSTASQLMFVCFPPSHHHHRHPSSFLTTLRNSARCPSHLWKDVGPNPNLSTHLRGEDAPPPTPPLSKGMWAAHSHSTEEFGRWKHEGRPRNWEAHAVCHETRATTFVVAHFLHSYFFHATPMTILFPKPT